ncbi:MAG: DUF58 domain-containing protein, partial [Gammaproteobacteria bacterium]|nr:DUF58 domain-containing protein [Gammaproteobacteria bacterium]
MSLAIFRNYSLANTSSPAGSDGLVYVSTSQLIQLHHAAQNLPLQAAKVRALRTGQYYSPFRGRGMEFDEVRLYQPGDDVRTLDWRVTARTGKAHTKLFREERERAVIVWVDYRSPMFFATRGVFKSVLASQTAALLAWSAHHQRDRIGGLIFAEDQHHELRPRGGKSAVLHLLQLLSRMSSAPMAEDRASAAAAAEQKSACYQALVRLRRVLKPGSLIFLISDFRDFDKQAESVLTQISRHNDVIMLFVYDPIEELLPDAGIYRVGNEQ